MNALLFERPVWFATGPLILEEEAQEMEDYTYHQPVLVTEVVELLEDAWRTDMSREDVIATAQSAERDLLDDRGLALGAVAGMCTFDWLLGHSAVVHPVPVPISSTVMPGWRSAAPSIAATTDGWLDELDDRQPS